MLLVSVAFAASVEPPVCVEYATGAATVSVAAMPASESSGLTTGIAEPGVYYTHDDGGNAPELYLFREDGILLGTQVVTGATNTDWEDIGAGPCPDAVDAATCLYIGDIGDNDGTRDTITLWVVPESLDPTVTALACELAYPDGQAHDAEALAVDPEGGIRILTKESTGATQVYRATGLACLGGVQTLTEEAELELDAPATGAAMRQDGTALVVRAKDRAWLWAGCALNLQAEPVAVDLPGEPFGEAVTFDADGLLVTTSEEDEFKIHVWPCQTQEELSCPACGCGASPPASAGALLLAATLVRARGRVRGRGAGTR